MSRVTYGTILKTASGKWIRTYRVQTHLGHQDHVQETPDPYCATIFREGHGDRMLRKVVDADYPDTTEVKIEVTRTIKITEEGNQPCLPL